ncbi:CGNR zinc finger domain-containing protein [Erwinia oleae]|uniref:CGNR zinc finger domain-containing protein n=1 Tax=Erwinia oleae TaxID=796334 RepID=UPI00055267B8|nr:ABATE domain-containing protein [Erwinia oleae]
MTTHSHVQAGGPLLVADHPALDFLNTVAQVEGQPYDFWQSDQDVLTWLARAVNVSAGNAEFDPGELLHQARRLRETIREGVEKKKTGAAVDVAALNGFLASARSYQQLVADDNGELHTERRYSTPSPEALLAPVAELAASLLAENRFELVRRCEHPECTLWFYDRTKAHRRRWCSMALCGNRAKVSRFRQQQK